MARIRYATYIFLRFIQPGVDLEEERSSLLRDILPDQGFKVHWVSVSIGSKAGVGDLVMIEIAKNITPKAPGTEGDFSTTHSHMYWLEMVKSAAAGTFELIKDHQVFVEPIDFDKNDQFNIRMWATNTEAAQQTAEFVLTIGYSVS